MAGITDGVFCRTFASIGCGMVVLGGVNADKKTQDAALLLHERGRQEFIFDNLEEWLIRNVGEARKGGKPVLVNVRSTSVEGYLGAASIIEREGGWVEVNAHCRQREIVEVGAGEALLRDTGRLEAILVGLRKKINCPLFLKFRGNVVEEQPIMRLAEKYCDGIHVDAFKEGDSHPDLTVLQRICPTSLFTIANNGIVDARIAETTFPFCDAFSFGRLAWTPKKVKTLLAKTSYYLFAYGTLTIQEKAQAIMGHEVPMADAVLHNFKKKSLGGIYFAYRSKGEAIEGKLLRLRLNDLLKLDKYEGVDFGMYERACVDVVVGDEKTKAYVYLAGKKMRG